MGIAQQLLAAQGDAFHLSDAQPVAQERIQRVGLQIIAVIDDMKRVF